MDNHFDTITRLDRTGQISKVLLSFHHINRGDGVKIQVFHSGTLDTDLVISGTLVGGPIVSKKKLNKKPDDIILVIAFAMGYFLLVIGGIIFAPPSLVQTIGTGFLIFIVVQ